MRKNLFWILILMGVGICALILNVPTQNVLSQGRGAVTPEMLGSEKVARTGTAISRDRRAQADGTDA